MLKRLAHALVKNPMVYDAVQIMAGVTFLDQWLSRRLSFIRPGMTVIDVGAGTGHAAQILPHGVTHIGLDNDPSKLSAFHRHIRNGGSLQADAIHMPLRDECADIVLCMFVLHHIPDDLVGRFYEEAHRVLRPGGRFIFIDPILNARRPVSRLLWRYDRGAFPRSAMTIHDVLSRRFTCEQRATFAIWHRYLLWIGTKH